MANPQPEKYLYGHIRETGEIQQIEPMAIL